MGKRWLYLAWRRLPTPVQRALLWWGNTRFLAGVLALIADERGRVLLLRHDYRLTGRWGLPGSWLRGREGIATALARELREETGLIVGVGEVLAVFRGKEQSRLQLIYRCRVAGGRLELGDEIAEARWCARAASCRAIWSPSRQSLCTAPSVVAVPHISPICRNRTFVLSCPVRQASGPDIRKPKGATQ